MPRNKEAEKEHRGRREKDGGTGGLTNSVCNVNESMRSLMASGSAVFNRLQDQEELLGSSRGRGKGSVDAIKMNVLVFFPIFH